MFRYWQNENSVKYKSNEEKRSVILAVDDGKVCVLYQFEIRPDDDYWLLFLCNTYFKYTEVLANEQWSQLGWSQTSCQAHQTKVYQSL